MRIHKTVVFYLEFSPDDTLLASASQDGEIILWDVDNFHQLGNSLKSSNESADRTQNVPIITFSLDGKSLFALDETGTFFSWTNNKDLWVENLCERLNRNFTQ